MRVRFANLMAFPEMTKKNFFSNKMASTRILVDSLNCIWSRKKSVCKWAILNKSNLLFYGDQFHTENEADFSDSSSVVWPQMPEHPKR